MEAQNISNSPRYTDPKEQSYKHNNNVCRDSTEPHTHHRNIHGHGIKQTGQWSRTEMPEINTHPYGLLFSIKV